MEYRRFGRSELKISVLSCGTMRSIASSDQMTQTIQRGFQSGINHIETASAYGNSEVLVGEALKQLNWPRDRYILTTKLVPTPPSASEIAAFEAQLIQSLERLQVDRIDCLALHGINTAEHLAWITHSHGCMAVVRDFVQAGKIDHVGFSTHGSLEIIQATIATRQFDFVNLHYGIFFQRNEPAIAQAAAADLGVFIISPGDKGGMLYRPPSRLQELCQPLSPLATNYRFLLSDDRIHTLSVGPANPEEWQQPIASIQALPTQIPAQVPAQVTPNIPTAIESTTISERPEQAIFDRLEAAQTEALGTDRCRQCYECLPCPEDINIPEILRLRNLTIAYDMKEFGQYRYGMFGKAGHWFPGVTGDRCTDCGDCLPRCPERLAIPTLLQDTHDRLAGKARRRLWDSRR